MFLGQVQEPGDGVRADSGWAVCAMGSTVAEGTATTASPVCSLCRSRSGDKGAAARVKIEAEPARQLDAEGAFS